MIVLFQEVFDQLLKEQSTVGDIIFLKLAKANSDFSAPTNISAAMIKKGRMDD